MQNRLTKIKGNLIILLTALIWGISFVSQKVGVESISAGEFNGIRCLLGAFVLLPAIFIFDKKKSAERLKKEKENRKKLLKGGLVCGLLLCFATALQTWGLYYTTSGKSGFITAMYMIFVPFIGAAVLKKKYPKTVFVAAAIAFFGLYLLCSSSVKAGFNQGDFLTLVCAVLFSFHILAVDKFSPEVDGLKLSCLQFLISGVLNLGYSLLVKKPDFQLILGCAVPLLYSGIMSCGVAYTLQIIGQKYTDAASASILMSLESVFALLAGMIILGESMSIIELLGCLLMFGAIVLNTMKS